MSHWRTICLLAGLSGASGLDATRDRYVLDLLESMLGGKHPEGRA